MEAELGTILDFNRKSSDHIEGVSQPFVGKRQPRGNFILLLRLSTVQGNLSHRLLLILRFNRFR